MIGSQLWNVTWMRKQCVCARVCVCVPHRSVPLLAITKVFLHEANHPLAAQAVRWIREDPSVDEVRESLKKVRLDSLRTKFVRVPPLSLPHSLTLPLVRWSAELSLARRSNSGAPLASRLLLARTSTTQFPTEVSMCWVSKLNVAIIRLSAAMHIIAFHL